MEKRTIKLILITSSILAVAGVSYYFYSRKREKELTKAYEMQIQELTKKYEVFN
jgi:hypothetical protein